MRDSFLSDFDSTSLIERRVTAQKTVSLFKILSEGHQGSLNQWKWFESFELHAIWFSVGQDLYGMQKF